MAGQQKNRTIIGVSAISLATGSMVMCGWIFNVPVLQRIVPGLVPMVFNIALGFVLFSCALLFTQCQKGKYRSVPFFILSLLGTLIGLITLSQYVFHFNSGLDQLFVTDSRNNYSLFPNEFSRVKIAKALPNPFFPGRMAVSSALCFALFGSGLLLVSIKKRLSDHIAQYIFHFINIFSAVVLIGYFYGVSLIHSLLYVASMSMQTAIFFILLSLAASLLNPSIGITGLFTGKQIGNVMARRLFSLIILMLIVFGEIRIQTQNFGLFQLNIGVALLVICFLLSCLIVIWNIAAWLNRIDTQRSEAEEQVIRINSSLEKIVEERTLAVQKSEERYRSLIEHASDAIYVVDLTGNFIDVNASMCEMTGYTRDELLKMNVEQIIDPEQLKIDPIKHGPHNPDESVMRERRFLRKNGSIFDAEVNVKMFNDDRVLVIARDITDRRYAEEVILKEKMLSDTIINSLPGIFYLITENGNQVRWNANYETVTGYTSKELPHLTSFDIVAPEDHEKVGKAIGKVFEDGFASVEASIKAKDGTRKPFLLTGTPILYEGQRCLLGVGIDISSRIWAEAELRTSEQKYKLLFDSSPMPLWMIDKDTLKIIAANDAVAGLYGYTRDELVNMSVLNLRSDGDRDRQLEGYRQDASGVAIDMGIVRHLKKDGTPMYVHIVAHDIELDGRPVRLSFTNDVTERLKAEESLRKSEANLQTILSTTKTAYALFDLQLKVLAFNQQAIEFMEAQYHHTPQKGDRLADYFPSERLPQFLAFTKEILQGKDISYESEYHQSDGRVLWYDIRLSPIASDSREIIGMLMTLDEITERKNAEQELKDAYSRIQNQINSIRGMAWKQSHLMRSPLANLKALADLLKSHPDDKQTLDHFQTELNRLDAIIQEMAKEASQHDG